MKYLIIIPIFSLLFLEGCYTVIMTPENRTSNSYEFYEFYPIDYYGNYSEYYDMPWWINSSLVTTNRVNIPIRTTSSEKLRNENGSRYVNDNHRDPIIISTPTRNTGSDLSENDNSSYGANNNHQTRSNTSSGQNSNNNSTRNENGNRNSGNSRR